MTALEHPLVGSWRLRRWAAIAEDATESLPMGDAPDGLLIYAADGSMIAAFGLGDRPPFDSDDVTGGTDDERARAFSTYVAYGGTYEVDGDTVHHRVETSLFPNWVGTVQRRRWELDLTGRQLSLTSPPVSLGGATRIQRLIWDRAQD
ncbi:MAG: lipocalin-like domain-containing protein [Candidatus Limnocylindrales bacterium]